MITVGRCAAAATPDAGLAVKEFTDLCLKKAAAERASVRTLLQGAWMRPARRREAEEDLAAYLESILASSFTVLHSHSAQDGDVCSSIDAQFQDQPLAGLGLLVHEQGDQPEHEEDAGHGEWDRRVHRLPVELEGVRRTPATTPPS